ncbi:DUF364 domain-containing protein [Thermosulfurimonas sp. F29]|uniref:DUF364 domain-containing protein n=1 Tax=Thermosulfurimonas sp. F29 TaxID=2867247 RepID=UPI001C82D86C|nr:DUF364 domain-containing protein [Thermosulfurimonas sp. F29]MBX6422281.1 DUF364 domain-containing protein [Thermosulfurimonas sp. F29]
MNLYARLMEMALPSARGRLLERVFVGLGYTAVELTGGLAGLAYTLFEAGCCEYLPREVVLHGRPADLVLRGLLSPHPLERTVALAVANALLNHRELPVVPGDVLDLVRPQPEDEVAIVGYFEPLYRKLSGRVKNLWVFEKGERLGPGLLSEAEMPEFLPRASLVFVTSVTLINRTLEDILSRIERAREVVLLGPSTPLAPEVFRDLPVSLLSGVRVRDSEGVFRAVAEARGFPGLKAFVEKVNVRV